MVPPVGKREQKETLLHGKLEGIKIEVNRMKNFSVTPICF